MEKTLLYLRGEPGSGKITTARILAKDLGWKLFWIHDLDAICQIIGSSKIPRLMDTVTEAVIRELFRKQENFIYVRPSRDRETVAGITFEARSFGYNVVIVNLNAAYDKLVERVTNRSSNGHRITTKEGLDEYLESRPQVAIHNETAIDTTWMKPEEVAAKIKGLL